MGLNLAVNYSSKSEDKVHACQPYRWIDGEVYDESNSSAQYVLLNAKGCDSVVSLKLTIPELNLGVTAADSALTAHEKNATYQWIHCDLGDLKGETHRSFHPKSNGRYAVIITKDSCVDTSDCINYKTTLLPNLQNAGYSVYSVSAGKMIVVDYTGLEHPLWCNIFDLSGRKIYTQNLQSGRNVISMQNWNSGLYMMAIKSNTGINSHLIRVD